MYKQHNNNDSGVFKTILQYRDKVKHAISRDMKDGESTSLWLDLG